MIGKLVLEDKTTIEGISFGAPKSVAGEVVFSTGMVGYPESFTDPSYSGQILVLTYPIIGSYGVPPKELWESDKIHIAGLIVCNYIDTPSHFESVKTLSQWLKKYHVPALEISDTRFLTQKIRTSGTMLGKIVINKNIDFIDQNTVNLLATVSTKKIYTIGPSASSGFKKTKLLLLDCGSKKNIAESLLKRNVEITIAPWDYNPFSTPRHPGRGSGISSGRPLEDSGSEAGMTGGFDGIVISNGPGDPKMADKTIVTVRQALEKKIPILGVCLGNQILALAGGGDTYKLKYGHRSQNQPCTLVGSNRCYITTQNHGFAVSNNLPKNFRPWFVNANDNSIEGIIHKTLPIMSSQFHPEAKPGPTDTEWIFDYFLKRLK